MIRALETGLRSAWRCRALAAFLLVVNIGSAAALAVPFATQLEHDLRETESAARMARGFDFPWWSHWSDQQQGLTTAFRPDIFGIGFAFRNTELLLRGQIPGRLLAPGAELDQRSPAEPDLDGVILALGVAYLLLQVFFTGGILGALRTPRGSLTARGFAHGSGFYFGRMLRIAALALLADWALFRLGVPLATWMAARAHDSVSEQTALAWAYGRNAFFLSGILAVHLLAGYARVITVLEERQSASLAFVSALAFCAGRLREALGHYLAIGALAVFALWLWASLDGAIVVVGWISQLLAFALMQAFVFVRLGLRLALLGGQMELYRGRSRPL
jgi:hypothetical protein